MAAITTCMSHCYGNTEHTLQFEDYNYMYLYVHLFPLDVPPWQVKSSSVR